MPVRYGIAVLFFLSTLVILPLSGCAPSGAATSNGGGPVDISLADTAVSVPGGDLSFQDFRVVLDGSTSYGMYIPSTSELSGTIVNRADRVLSGVMFDLVAFDATGTPLSSQQIIKLERFPPNSTIDLYGETLNGLNLDTEGVRPARVEIRGVRAPFPVDYTFLMTSPETSESLSFSDETIDISFALARDEMGFALRNNAGEPIRINWDEVSYVDPSGSSHRVMHSGVKYSERNNPQAPTTVPPGARIEDILQPTDMVEYSDVLSEWREDNFFPGSNAALETVGQTFSVFMPLDIGGERVNYNFVFEIADVDFERR